MGYHTTLAQTQKGNNQHRHCRENYVEQLDPPNSRLRFMLEDTESAKENVRTDSVCLYWNILSGKGIQHLNVSEQVFIERKTFNYIQLVHNCFPADSPGRELAWEESKSSVQALLYAWRWWGNTDVDLAETGMDPIRHRRNNFQSTFRWFVTNAIHTETIQQNYKSR